MPNRILKETIHESESLNGITDFQFRLWAHLLVYVDDFGRGDARPAVVKGHCFPLRDRLTNKDVEAALKALANAGCIDLYEVDGKPYLCFPTWESHQTVRNQRSKYPAPDLNAIAINCKQLKSIENNCMQLQADEINCNQLQSIASNCSRNPIQSNTIQSLSESESESLSESESNPNVGIEPETGSPPAEVAYRLPLVSGEFHEVTVDDIDNWEKLYPAVDVRQEIRKMIGWLESNPSRRKTKRGVKAFINGWLSREQDRGPAQGQVPRYTSPAPKPNQALEYQQRKYKDDDLDKYFADPASIKFGNDR